MLGETKAHRMPDTTKNPMT